MTTNFNKYVKTFYGSKLLKKHSLKEYGIWRVTGEDPNCDMGGYHHMPYLGTFEGTLEDVITLAVELPGFWQWGGGGEIDKTNVTKIDRNTIEIRNRQRTRLEELTKETEFLKKELGLH